MKSCCMKNLIFWMKLCLLNFFIVSVVGVMMRYKIAFSLPMFNQKFLQESHSHFAFYGWVATCLYVLMTDFMFRNHSVRLRNYQIILYINLVGSYGMLLSFMYGGYYWLSIVFSTLSLLTGFMFFYRLLKDAKKAVTNSMMWFRGGSFFAVFSSIGIFMTAYLSAQGQKGDWLYKASTYFYLHFQYNGFFLFCCIGLLIDAMKQRGIELSKQLNKQIFYGLFVSSLLGYGLSVLWIQMHSGLYLFFVLVSLAQLGFALRLAIFVQSKWKYFTMKWPVYLKTLLGISSIVLLIKIIGQVASTIPQFSVYTFGIHNLIIAYLHWVLLLGISVFLLWKIFSQGVFLISSITKLSIYLFLFGALFNEFILIISAVLSINLKVFRLAPLGLLFASVVMMISLLIIFCSKVVKSS